jgi:diguanylate cyclase (GGDEF)-like protein
MAQTFIEKALRENTPISIFLFDIDNFKHYNDTNGHDEGDKLLVELSDLVRSVTRKNSVIIRYGGEEFLVMLPAISKEDASVYAERFREGVSSHPFLHGAKQPLGCVSISGGIASFPIDGETIFKVIQHADKALYQAKSEGKNRIKQYTQKCFSYVTAEQDALHVPHFTLTYVGGARKEPNMAAVARCRHRSGREKPSINPAGDELIHKSKQICKFILI